MPVKYEEARRFALSLPGVSEEPHFGVPSFRVNKRMLVTVPPGDMLHVFVADAEREMCLMVYASCTEKVWWGGKVVGIRIFLKKATRGAVEDLILRAWKHRAPKKDVAVYEGQSASKEASMKAKAPARKEAARNSTKAGGARSPGAKSNAARSGGTKSNARSSDEKMGTVASVDAYIAGFSPEIRARLAKVRATIRKAAPQASEEVSYRIAGYKLEGVLIYFAGFAEHIGLYPAPRQSAEFRDELAAYGGGKGTVQFPHDKPLPLGLIRRIVKFRVAENLARAALRKKTPAAKAAMKLREKAPRKVGSRE